ncbi:hypothetical protein EYF80_022096 [Liparis tanakae]|uniref:Uncharacterized protein n=1 Tax=Liparis tanakae TaxID=230148 RepID=A0A4Z2HS46_9TELE|nr:hypothetical protein EYF80_022096 [Liparis tanakae]
MMSHLQGKRLDVSSVCLSPKNTQIILGIDPHPHPHPHLHGYSVPVYRLCQPSTFGTRARN